MSGSLVLVGGGEHARVVAEAARSAGLELAGFVDPQPCRTTVERLGLVRLGDDSALLSLPDVWGILGVGAVGAQAVRRMIVERVRPHVVGWKAVVHRMAWVSPTATIAEGAVIMAGAIINAGAQIGRHCIVNTGSVVEHDVVLGDFSQLAPGVTVGGGVRIGPDVFIGLGAGLRDHIVVGAGAFVGMGATVAADVPEGARIRGALTHIANSEAIG